MKKTLLALLLLVGYATTVHAQNDALSARCDGMYIAQTGGEQGFRINKTKTYTYLRFFEDGKMVSQTVDTYSPDAVARWLGSNSKGFERSGMSKIDGDDIVILTNNQESSDLFLEGPLNTNYRGKIISPELLSLEVEYNSGEAELFDFRFVEIEMCKKEEQEKIK